MQLREYQLDVLDRARAAFAAGSRSVCVQMPTGAGKGECIAHAVESAVERGGRVLVVVPRIVLADDMARRIRGRGLRVGVLQADTASDADPQAWVATEQTLGERGVLPEVSLVIIDEAHHAGSAGLRAFIARITCRLLGFTATPIRADGQPLDMFRELVQGPSVADLTRMGHLVPCTVYAPPALLEPGQIAQDPIEVFASRAPGGRALVFCETTEHARAEWSKATLRGIPSELLLADTDRETRNGLESRIASGATRMVVAVGVPGEGFDCPPFDTIILSRGCSHVGSFLQRIGRGLRPSLATGKRACEVFDLCGSVYLHGLPDAERRWSLEGDACVRTDKVSAVACCPDCGAVFVPARECPRCGGRALVKHRVKLQRSMGQRLEDVSGIPQWELDDRAMRGIRHGYVERRFGRLPEDAKYRMTLEAFLKRFKRLPVKRPDAGAA